MTFWRAWPQISSLLRPDDLRSTTSEMISTHWLVVRTLVAFISTCLCSGNFMVGIFSSSLASWLHRFLCLFLSIIPPLSLLIRCHSMYLHNVDISVLEFSYFFFSISREVDDLIFLALLFKFLCEMVFCHFHNPLVRKSFESFEAV